MSVIRPLVAADLGPLAALRNRSDQQPDRDPAPIEHFYRTRFLDPPCRDDVVGSLVCAEEDGQLSGFYGAVPRTLVRGDREIRVALLSHFMNDPDTGAGLKAVQLLRTMWDGPQDLSLTDEATPALETIWRGLRGASADALHLYWVRPLRPARQLRSRLRDRGRGARGLAALSRPAAAPVDAVFARLPQTRQRGFTPPLERVPLSAEELLAEWERFGRTRSMHSRPDPATLAWMLERAAERRDAGELVVEGFRRPGGRLVGWTLRYRNRKGVCQVVQLAAMPRNVGDVLDSLFHAAWREGAIAVTGRLELPFLGELADRHCLFERSNARTLVHSRDPDLVTAFQAGDVFFSRLEGEWCLWFPLPEAHPR